MKLPFALGVAYNRGSARRKYLEKTAYHSWQKRHWYPLPSHNVTIVPTCSYSTCPGLPYCAMNRSTSEPAPMPERDGTISSSFSRRATRATSLRTCPCLWQHIRHKCPRGHLPITRDHYVEHTRACLHPKASASCARRAMRNRTLPQAKHRDTRVAR